MAFLPLSSATYGSGRSIVLNNTSGATLYYLQTDSAQALLSAGSIAIGGSLTLSLPANPPSNYQQGNNIFFSNNDLSSYSGAFNTPDYFKDQNLAFSQFEYAYSTSGTLGNGFPSGGGGINLDFSYVDGFAFPLQFSFDWSSTFGPQPFGGSGGTLSSSVFGLGGSFNGYSAADLVRLYLASTPFINPSQSVNFPPSSYAGQAVSAGSLIWGSNIIAPNKIWAQQNGNGVVPSALSNFTITANGFDLSQANAYPNNPNFNGGGTSNFDGWKNALGKIVVNSAGRTSLFQEGVINGYTEALQWATSKLGGINPLFIPPNQNYFALQYPLVDNFQGFYSWPQENPIGGITYLADQVSFSVNVGPLSSSNLRLGTQRNDLITGTRSDDVIVGGYGGDLLSGGASPFANLLASAVTAWRPSALVDAVLGSSAANRARFFSQRPDGHDRFVYVRPDSSFHGQGTRDLIVDFNVQQDVIDLSLMDANTQQPGDQSFVFIGARSFTQGAGQLRFSQGLLQGDVDGNGRADFEVQLLGVQQLPFQALVL